MKLGAHESTSGGLYRAISLGVQDGCESLQIFTKNSNRWIAKPLDETTVAQFKTELKQSSIAKNCVMTHASYLINLATPDESLFEKSLNALKDEVERCATLDIPLLVVHPGAHMGTGEDAGIARVAEAINRVHAETAHLTVKILIENTAGQGSSIGSHFDQIAKMLHSITQKDRIGVCFDTCHAFSANYPIHTEAGFQQTLGEIENLFGLDQILAFHLNDAKKPLGARVDRHENIGKGHIGLSCFKMLLNEKRFQHIPAVLETPPLEDGNSGYRENLTLLRELLV